MLITYPKQMLVFEKCALSDARSCDQFWGVWFIKGHMSSISYWFKCNTLGVAVVSMVTLDVKQGL